MTCPIEGAPLPLRPACPFLRVVWPRGTAPLTVVLLGSGFGALWTHFWCGRASVCYGEGACIDCGKQAPRFTGFAPAYETQAGKLVVVRFSEWVSKQLTDLSRESGSLRGLKVTLRRRPGDVCAPVDVTNLGMVARPELLPAEFDPWPSMNRLLGVPPGWRPSRLPSPAAIAGGGPLYLANQPATKAAVNGGADLGASA